MGVFSFVHLQPHRLTSPLALAFRAARTATVSRAHTEYATRPEDWIVEKLGIPRHTVRWSLNDNYRGHEWDGTVDPMVTVLEALAAWENVGVESGTTTGKTFLGACIVLWFLACFEDSLVVTGAPKKEQLTLHIWKEIGRLWPRFQALFPEAQRDTLRIRMRPDLDTWSAHGFVAGVRAEEVEGSATKAQGFHAEHMLIVFEETPGMHGAIMEAFKQTCRAPHNLRLAFGNPDHQADQLHRFCTAPRVRHVRVSALDHPNVVTGNANLIPGAVSAQGIEVARAEDGEDSRMFKSRVRGISPAESVDALIKWEWCEAAAQADRDALRLVGEGRRAKGVDVANSERGDKAAISDWVGAVCEDVRSFPCPNANDLGRNVFREMGAKRDKRERIIGWDVQPEHVGVDPVGVGAATVNTLYEETGGYAVQALNGGQRPIERTQRAPDGTTYDWAPDANSFNNLRSQMWWQMREDLRLGRIALPKNLALFRQLTAPTYEPRAGKVIVESKLEIKKRLGASPDDADAVVYGNWVRPRAVIPKEPERVYEPDRDPIAAAMEEGRWDDLTHGPMTDLGPGF